MCKYSYQCKLCGIQIEVKAEQQNVQDVMVELASECPSLDIIAQAPISLDAIYELMVPKERSLLMQLLKEHSHPEDCSVYDSVVDAIGKALGRYYEIA